MEKKTYASTVQKTFMQRIFGGATPELEPEPDVPPLPRVELENTENGFKIVPIPFFDNVPSGMERVRIVCVGDAHGSIHTLDIPDGDILIVAGDFSMGAGDEEVRVFDEFLGTMPHSIKIVIPGQHEIQNISKLKKSFKNCHFLHKESISLRGITFYCTNSILRGEEVNNPQFQCDILVSHSPPRGWGLPTEPGSAEMMKVIEKYKPIVHVFGGNHAGGGKAWQNDHTVLMNCSCCVGGAIGTKRRPGLCFDFVPYSYIEVGDHAKKSKFSASDRAAAAENDSTPRGGRAVKKDDYLILMAKTTKQKGDNWVRRL